MISSESNRTQEANRREAVERLAAIITEAAFIPKFRKPTKPTAGSVKRRLESKAKRSATKKQRGSKFDFD